MSDQTIAIGREAPDQPDVVALIQALDAYHTSLYPAESNHPISIAALTEPSVAFFVARLDGRVVGCGAIRQDCRGYGEVKRMYVLPAMRGRRVGARILSALEEVARAWRVPAMCLETGIHNADALGLYRRAGFAEAAPFGDYTADPLSVFMRKDL